MLLRLSRVPAPRGLAAARRYHCHPKLLAAGAGVRAELGTAASAAARRGGSAAQPALRRENRPVAQPGDAHGGLPLSQLRPGSNPSRAPTPARKSPRDVQINTQLRSAKSPVTVLEVIRSARNGTGGLNSINFATALHRLAKLTSVQQSAERSAFFLAHDRPVRRLLLEIRTALPTFECNQLVACAYACSLITHGPTRQAFDDIRELLFAIGPLAAPLVSTLHSQGMANLLWAHAEADVQAPELVNALAPVALRCIGEFSIEGLSSLAWSCAKLQLNEGPLMGAIATQVIARHACDSNEGTPPAAGLRGERVGPRELTILAWSFGTVAEAPEREALFETLAREAVPQLRSFRPRDLSQLVWTFAKARYAARELFDEVARVAPSNLESFNSQDFANMMWAYATAGVEADQLFRAVAVTVQPSLRDFTPQGLANLAWAFAKTGTPSAQLLLETIAVVFPPRLPDLGARDIAMLVWAFSKYGVHSEAVERAYRAVECELEERQLSSFSHVELANTAWAFATARVFAPALFQRIATEVVHRAAHFEPQTLANVAWSLARSRTPAPAAFAAICAAVECWPPSDFSPQNHASLLWAFAFSGSDAARLLDSLAPAIVLRSAEFKAIDLANMAWALAASLQMRPVLMATLLERLELLKDVPEHAIGGLELLCQVHQAHMALQLEAPELGLRLSDAMGQRCALAMREVELGNAQMSRRHQLVSAALHRAGHAHANEHFLPFLGYMVDIVLHETNVVVEVHGVASYDAQRRTLPSTAMRTRHMQLRGWQVIEIPPWEWPSELKEQESYLSRRLGAVARDIAAPSSTALRHHHSLLASCPGQPGGCTFRPQLWQQPHAQQRRASSVTSAAPSVRRARRGGHSADEQEEA
ncbi:hypothetical protein T492DRAFT_950140 [Pavlovales sp. CCMP2436]|nr:hypothetical protein T492DRAFT_950140 [Pavlovales sp. CCMP2436]